MHCISLVVAVAITLKKKKKKKKKCLRKKVFALFIYSPPSKYNISKAQTKKFNKIIL
jgi:hypothetical protein